MGTLTMHGVFNSDYEFMPEVFGDFASEIDRKIEAIILDRLNELGLPFDLETEEQRKFKRLMRVKSGNEETIYYNDGSIEGLKIVTFRTNYSYSVCNATATLTHEFPDK